MIGTSGVEQRTSLVDLLLAEQAARGTAVDRFSEWHDDAAHAPAGDFYRRLIPLTKPGPGEQFGFEVNLDRCTGCKACVAACHALNGLDDDESWRDVGLLTGDDYTPWHQTVTTACHHCADPACAAGCPVLAYHKEESTGIVRHLDDQCIGCSYCILKCPYDVPKYNKKRGIVRKCDMCHQRLEAGEAPACVQSCPNEAIAIRIVPAAELSGPAPFGAVRLLPGAVDSSYTRPSTRYVSERAMPEGVAPADGDRPKPEHTHPPLVAMLILTQFAAGLACFGRDPATLWLAAATGAAGAGASVLHLGQPLKAFRCFLGWRRSWLSREILAFGGFVPALAAAAAGWIPAAAAGVAGLVSVYCSVMVYADTHRPFWSFPRVAAKFFGTTVALALTALACVDATLATPAMLAALAKLACEAPILASQNPSLRRSQVLLRHPLQTMHAARFVAGLSGAVLIAAAPVAGFLLFLAGEVMERILFFRAAAAWKMPGGL